MYGIVIVLGLLMGPVVSYASPCSNFEWHYPTEIVEPEIFHKAREAMTHGEYTEARQGFLAYLKDHSEGTLAEAAHYALASLPAQDDSPDKKSLNMIERLSTQRNRDPQSPYAPWALCRIGELYDEAGWTSEANAIFEEFLETYADHPLSGGVLLNAGQNFLKEAQYIEASLVFRRLVHEPKWARYHLESALGLANATAFSQAWDQAYYWYQVVDVEKPELIRASATAAYRYAESEAKLGDPLQAITWYLTAYNLHPQTLEAGYSLNKIGDYLIENHREMAALWFFQEASLRYRQEEPGRRGEAALTRWVVSYLSSEHSKDEWRVLYDRLNALEIYLAVSWDGVIETSRLLAQAPESDVAEEAQFYLAKGYEELGDIEGAMDAYGQLALSGQHDPWKKSAQEILEAIFVDQFRTYAKRHQWVELLRFYEKQQLMFSFLPKNPEWMRMIAEAYRHIGLSRQAMRWYDEILNLNPAMKQKEEILFDYVVLAKEIREPALIRKRAQAYLQAYPQGQWREDVSLIQGKLDVSEQHFKQSIEHLTEVLDHGHDQKKQTEALRARARAYYELKQYDLAIKDYQRLVNGPSATLGVKIALADLLYEQKRYAKAIVLYQSIAKSASIAEAKTWAQFRLALCYQETGKPEMAKKLLEGIRQPGQDIQDLEMTIRAAAAAVIDEFIHTNSTS